MSMTSQDETTRSKPHRRVERILDGMKVSYLSEHTEFAPYSLDLYLGEYHAAVEVDGPTHSRAKNAKRDGHLLAEYGVPVLHLGTNETVEVVQDEVRKFIAEHAPTAKERKHAWLDK